MKRVLVIAHEPDGPAREIETRLVERGLAVETHIVTPDYDRPDTANEWPSFDDYDIVIPMGSVRSLTRKQEIASWIDHELTMLRDAHDAGTPILGICFGGQLMAEALGGTVEVSPVTEIGWFEIEASPGHENPAGPGPWKEWHHDRFIAPEGADVLAHNENATQLFRMGKTVGTQFHPEVNIEHISGWLATCNDDYLHQHGVNRADILADVQSNETQNIKQCHAFVDWFLDEVAFPNEELA